MFSDRRMATTRIRTTVTKSCRANSRSTQLRFRTAHTTVIRRCTALLRSLRIVSRQCDLPAIGVRVRLYNFLKKINRTVSVNTALRFNERLCHFKNCKTIFTDFTDMLHLSLRSAYLIETIDLYKN